MFKNDSLAYLKSIIAHREAGLLTDKQFDIALGAYIYSRPDVLPYVLTLLDVERKANAEMIQEVGGVTSMAFSLTHPDKKLAKVDKQLIFDKFKDLYDKYSQLPLTFLVPGYSKNEER